MVGRGRGDGDSFPEMSLDVARTDVSVLMSKKEGTEINFKSNH